MASKRKPWQKTLYGNYGYPDNYTDPTFLKDMQTNKNVKFFTFSEAFVGAARLNHQISTIIMFLLAFYSMYQDNITPEHIIVYSTLFTILGYFIFILMDSRTGVIWHDVKTVLSFLVFGYLFSPMLHTLTNSISTDTIFTLTLFVLMLHLIFFDYGLPAFLVSKAISLNAAFFGSICLSSRLATSFHAFTMLVVSVEFFVLFPIFINRFWTPYLLLPISLVCSYLLFNISTTALCLYLLMLVFINIACPYVFVYQQKYKKNIHGPWDEAIVKDVDITMSG